MRFGVAPLPTRANDRAAQGRRDRAGAVIELETPHKCAAVDIRGEGCRTLAQHGWVERNSAIGSVERLAPAAGLRIERTARGDKRGYIGDRVVQHRTRPRAFEVHRLIEVARPLRINRQKLDLAQVVEARGLGIGAHVPGGCLRFGEDFGREITREVESCAKAGERCGQGIASGGRDEVGSASGHHVSVWLRHPLMAFCQSPRRRSHVSAAPPRLDHRGHSSLALLPPYAS